MNKVIKIRKSVFETNSSSTHSICIARDVNLNTPKSIYFGFGEFGWECDTLDSTKKKASYLYTGMAANGRLDEFNELKKKLEGKGVVVKAEEPIWKESTYNPGVKYIDNGGYVDHSDELSAFINAVCEDEGKLFRFLFSPLSFIITGNDNDDDDVAINVDYEYDEYYKGN